MSSANSTASIILVLTNVILAGSALYANYHAIEVFRLSVETFKRQVILEQGLMSHSDLREAIEHLRKPDGSIDAAARHLNAIGIRWRVAAQSIASTEVVGLDIHIKGILSDLQRNDRSSAVEKCILLEKDFVDYLTRVMTEDQK